MRRIKAVLGSIAFASALSLAFWCLIALSLPATAFDPDNREAQPLPARVRLRRLENVQTPPAMTTTVSPAAVFSDIEVITTTVTTPDVTQLARELALALDLDAQDIVAAHLMCDERAGGCTDPAAVAVLGLAPGTWFPTRGTSFALLSTGRVTDVLAVEQEQSFEPLEPEQLFAAEVLTGMDNGQGNDLVRLHLQLNVPHSANCLALDFTFYTVDLADRFVPANNYISSYGDLFTAQVNEPYLDVAGKTITAPGNIAFSQDNNPVAVQTMLPEAIFEALTSPPGSTITGALPLLQMRHAVTGGEQIDLYLSIQDADDSYASSAVALDNFAWLSGADGYSCLPNTGYSGDRDGDGLPNGWEEWGSYARDLTGALHHLDLHALGADPDIKDIFVEVDAMQPLTTAEFFFNPAPLTQSIAYIVDAFARQDIHLHVDYGPHSPLRRQIDDGTDGNIAGNHESGDWGQGNVLSETAQPYLCRDKCMYYSEPQCYGHLDPLWTALDRIKQTNFSAERSPVFHYALFAHKLYNRPDAIRFCSYPDRISGLSRNILRHVDGASDFIVSLGDPYWAKNVTETQQAGTFMHELGHNLGLNHYGTVEEDEENSLLRKPNHLSVMNYLYQTAGLVVSEPSFLFDYLRYDMITLTEEFLTETAGLHLADSGISVTYTVGARWLCYPDPKDPEAITVTEDATTVNWDCDNGLHNTGIQFNVTGDLNGKTPIHSTLAAHKEWDRLVFTGGQLNRQRSLLRPFPGGELTVPGPVPLPQVEPLIERRPIVLEPIQESAVDRQILEELTPQLDQAIPKDLFFLEPDLELDDFSRDSIRDFLNSVGQWDWRNLPEKLEQLGIPVPFGPTDTP